MFFFFVYTENVKYHLAATAVSLLFVTINNATKHFTFIYLVKIKRYFIWWGRDAPVIFSCVQSSDQPHPSVQPLYVSDLCFPFHSFREMRKQILKTFPISKAIQYS